MKPTFFTAIFLTVSLFCQAQKIVSVSGTAFDTTKGRNPVQIVLNDTLRKFAERKAPDWNVYTKLLFDSSYVVRTGKDGKFAIRGKRTDSLYFSSYRHISKTYCIADLLKMKSLTISLKPEVCDFVPCNDTLPAKLYALVAEKINIASVQRNYNCNYFSWDGEFAAEYRIIENVYGYYPNDTIRFTYFTHGHFLIPNFKHVLLFVGEYCGKLYLEKYQIFDVYKTIEGKWASPGDPYRFDKWVEQKNIKAQVMQFADTLNLVTTYGYGLSKKLFPEEYFRIEGNKAIPLMGTYVKDLVTVKKEGSLKGKIKQQ